MRKILLMLGMLSLSTTSILTTTACSSTSTTIGSYSWTTSFSGDNNSWIEGSTTLKNINASTTYKFKKYDFATVLPLYKSYATAWFLDNKLTATTDINEEQTPNQTTISGAADSKTAFLMGYIDNSRNQEAVENSIKNKSWESIFSTADAASKYDTLNYFYLQAPNGSDAKTYVTDSEGNIKVSLTVYFLQGAKSATNTIIVNKVENASVLLNLKYQQYNFSLKKCK